MQQFCRFLAWRGLAADPGRLWATFLHLLSAHLLLTVGRRCRLSDAPTETRVFYMFLGMNHGPITVCRLLGSTIRRGIVHLSFSVAEGPGVAFCVKHRHAQLGTCSFALVWHGSRRHVYVCWHRFANEGTSPELDVISCCFAFWPSSRGGPWVLGVSGRGLGDSAGPGLQDFLRPCGEVGR